MSQITDDYLDARRESIRNSLAEIANDIGMEMHNVGLCIPIYIAIPHTGDALASLVTPLDPSDDEWSRVVDIACRVIQAKIGCRTLGNRALTCMMVNGPIAAAEVAAE